MYSLPTPLSLLTSPLKKFEFKTLIKKRVIDYWETALRLEVSLCPSLLFFKSHFMSLIKTHPIWTTAGSSPSKVTMATQCKQQWPQEDIELAP